MRNARSLPWASLPAPAGKLTAPTIPTAGKGIIAGTILIPTKNNYSLTEFSSLVGSVGGGSKNVFFPYKKLEFKFQADQFLILSTLED